MKVLAIDPGLAATGWALVDGMKHLASGTITTNPGDGDVVKRAHIIVTRIWEAVKIHPDMMGLGDIVVEYPEVSFGGKAYKGVMENFFVAGFIAGNFNFMNVVSVNPAIWCKSYKGRMGDRMEAARNMAVRAFKVTKRTSEHERDALGIALWAVTGGIR